MEWPMSATGPEPLSTESLEDLWPDLRGANRASKKRERHVETSEARNVQAKPAEQAQGDQEVEEEDIVFNEDEDPWHEMA